MTACGTIAVAGEAAAGTAIETTVNTAAHRSATAVIGTCAVTSGATVAAFPSGDEFFINSSK